MSNEDRIRDLERNNESLKALMLKYKKERDEYFNKLTSEEPHSNAYGVQEQLDRANAKLEKIYGIITGVGQGGSH